MAKSRLSELVNTAEKILVDTTLLTTPKRWFKNGDRGHLHATSHCYKYSHYGSGSRDVELSLLQAAKKQQCSACCDASALPAELVRLAAAAHGAERLLAMLERTLTGAVSELGAGIETTREARSLIERLSEEDIDRAEAGLTELRERLDTMERSLRERLTAENSKVIPYAVSSLMRQATGSLLTEVVPGSTLQDHALFGNSPKGERYSNQLVRIFMFWTSKRQQGATAALELAQAVALETNLERLDQLTFEVSLHGSGEFLSVVSERLWRKEITERITERLVPAWEQRWTDLESRTEPTLVGLWKEPRADQTRTLIEAFPHARGNNTRVVLVPRMIADWFETFERGWENRRVQTTGGCPVEHLEVVAALWMPEDTAGSYAEIADAALAAAAI